MMDTTKQVFIVWTNTDLTEGRGRQIPIHVCETMATARRIASKKGVMGSDADVHPFEAIYHNGSWCCPVAIVAPTDDDKRKQEQLDAKSKVMEKAIAAGLTKEDLAALGVK